MTTPRYEIKTARQASMIPHRMSIPKKVTLLCSESVDNTESCLLKKGDKVKTGQKLKLTETSQSYVISTITGIISSLYPYTGDYGRTYTAIVIEGDEKEISDDQFKTVYENPTLKNAIDFLSNAPGAPQLELFTNPEKPIRTIIVCGLDSDVLVTTNQFIISTETEAVQSGIEVLKKITGIEQILIVVPRNVVQGYGEMGAQMKAVDEAYPATLPHSVIWNVLGLEIPAGKSFEDLGIAFLSAEAVASIGRAYETGQLPLTKTLTLIRKNGMQTLITTRVGTPISDIITAFKETVNDRDRIVIGGPMRGTCVYREEYPVLPDTDALFIQDRQNITLASDYPCINCGECIRVCPAKIPVNMLIRFLEAGQYETAADQYDLYSCIDCGLCSFVCVSKIPIFQYIRLAKYELSRSQSSEASNG